MAKSKKKATISKKVEKRPNSQRDQWDDIEDFPEVEEQEQLEEATRSEVKAATLLKEYPAPKRDKLFVEKWNEYLPDVAKRDNFKRGHLSQLELLCDLHVEYKKLVDFIDKNGYTYKAVGRNGVQHKAWPQVGQRNRVLGEIRMYAKHLGLLLMKDKNVNTDKESEKEWT